MQIQRRRLFRASAALLPAALAGTAHAETTDLVVACDTALGPAMRLAASAFTHRSGVRIRLFPTSPSLIVPQLEREVQNDLIVTQLEILGRVEKAHQLASVRRAGPWLNRLVLARRPDGGKDTEPIAVTDPSPVSLLDGHAVLQRLQPDARSVIGAVDTSGVAFLLSTRAAVTGLLFLTDARANGFEVLAEVPAAVAAPVQVAAAVSRNARRPDPDAFLAFLASAEAATLLRAAGLESVA